MQISVKSNMDELSRKLPRFLNKRLPNITKNSLNNTAFQVAKKLYPQDVEKQLHQPVRYTKSGVLYKNATTASLTAAVYFKPQVWDYMKRQVNGGTWKGQSSKGVIIPLTKERNKFGNVTQAKRRRWSQSPKTFWAKDESGQLVLYQRFGRGGKNIRRLAIAKPRVEYTKRYDYEGTVQRGIDTIFIRAWEKQIEREINKLL